MDLNKAVEAVPGGIFGIAFGAATVLIGALGVGYTFGKDTGEKELQVYKALNDLNVKAVVPTLTSVSDILKKYADQIIADDNMKNEYANLKGLLESSEKKRAELQSSDAKLRADISERDQRIAELQAAAAFANPEITSYRIEKNKAVMMLPGIYISQSGVASSSAQLYVNGTRQEYINIGSSMPIYLSKTQKSDCQIVLMSVTPIVDILEVELRCPKK